jgi:hypothetical protein
MATIISPPREGSKVPFAEDRLFEVDEPVQVRIPGRHGWHDAVVKSAKMNKTSYWYRHFRPF